MGGFVLLTLGLAALGLLFAGALLGWQAYFRIRRLESRVDTLSWQLGRATAPAPDAPAAAQPARAAADTEFDLQLPDTAAASATDGGDTVQTAAPLPPTPPQPSRFWRQLRRQWMVWLGGLCVALAGVFMVRYSIEQGLLGPARRVAMGLLAGVALHGGAEWLRRRGGHHPAFAALAGGGSITLYAALLAALHLYQLLPANLVFLALAAVSLATMILALRQGPLMAAFGLLGGYLVPVLVSTGSGELYTYSAVWLVIAVGALLAGAIRRWRGLSRYGFVLLALVIGKIFLVDMSDLEGQLRVASFYGPGPVPARPGLPDNPARAPTTRRPAPEHSPKAAGIRRHGYC